MSTKHFYIKCTAIACIGSRALLPEEKELCFNIGKTLIQSGYCLKSGNAMGADQSYASGANSVDPRLVYLYLPWPSYNKENIVSGNYFLDTPKSEWFAIAANYHSYWSKLSQGARRLHARNVGIVEGVKFVIAYPGKGYGGGTAMGMRIAAANGIPVYNLRENINCLSGVI